MKLRRQNKIKLVSRIKKNSYAKQPLVLISSLRISKKNVILVSKCLICFLIFYLAFSYRYYFGNFLLRFTISSLKYGSSYLESFTPSADDPDLVNDEYYDVRKVLKEASTKEKLVILTFLNNAWASPDSIFGLFLESFRIGNNTAWLLNHLLVIAMDDDAFFRCQTLGLHCYLLSTYQPSEIAAHANFMTSNYLDMIWTRLGFSHVVLSLGYNFIVTDTDIMWLRDPIPYLSLDYDIQTSCDTYNGREFDLENSLNVGFMMVRSNNRTIEFYKFWLSSRQKYPKLHEQDVFHKIKFNPILEKVGLNVRYLDTDYFGGFCSPSRDFNKVCTMHANCCVGLNNKVADLKTTLEDWKNYLSSTQKPHSLSQPSRWRVPHKCHM